MGTPTVRELLTYARKRVEDGWRKGALGTWTAENTAVCALGALYAARFHLDGMTEAEVNVEASLYDANADSDLPLPSAIRVLSECLPESFEDSIVEFNDDEDTTREDVLRAFDCAIRGVTDA